MLFLSKTFYSNTNLFQEISTEITECACLGSKSTSFSLSLSLSQQVPQIQLLLSHHIHSPSALLVLPPACPTMLNITVIEFCKNENQVKIQKLMYK